MSIYLGTLELEYFKDFLDLESTFDIWIDILFGTWDYLLSMVGVGHLGSMQLGGSDFYSYHWDSYVATMAGISLSVFPFILSLYHYDGWLYLMMDVYIFYDGMVDGFIYCILICTMGPMRMM